MVANQLTTLNYQRVFKPLITYIYILIHMYIYTHYNHYIYPNIVIPPLFVRCIYPLYC